MPNHLTTVCRVTGNDAAAFFEAHFKTTKGSDDSLTFDFETIRAKPEIVDKTEPGFPLSKVSHIDHVLEWAEEKAATDKELADALKKGRDAVQCFRETGHWNWYDWDIANWGTKWNSYACHVRDRTASSVLFEFQTAWSFPEPIFEALAERYPELIFETETIDEGGGEFVGRYAGDLRTFERVSDDDARYERVYGRKRDTEDDEEDEDGESGSGAEVGSP